ncbi:MAG TPA: DUF5682 family protein, partial [Ilumatobacteraceae bacterium]|nr:DUF5682 family protein [Ilumatobacteraceae bacterium]
MTARVRLFGIRHHGPGSARAVQRTLAADPPQVVLIEGPSEADAIVGLAGDPQMRPPVTLLGYVPDDLSRAMFFPFASFSPEWVAMRWALANHVPVHFVDLALRHTLATWPAEALVALPTAPDRPADPLAALAAAGGYDDAERWWEDVVEHRDGMSPFDAIAEAMTVLRAAYEPDLVPAAPLERRREAQMRAGIRSAVATGHTDIAVVCGAWHVPALADALDARVARLDAALLRGMPKAKVAITWVPWTHRRLASATGYGAGVSAPGWYHHLFTHPGSDSVARWFTHGARLLRERGYSAPVADVVEATRLATSLAAVRGRPMPGLAEVSDAARAVLGDGTDTPMVLLHDELVVGRQIGRVPDSTPMVPLARNLGAEQRACRLRPDGSITTLELDLRKPLDLRRSHLLHRLALLGIPWGTLTEGRGSTGTFRETWTMSWEPEYDVRLIEASALGTTVEVAAVAAVGQHAGEDAALARLTEAVEQCLAADLAAPVPGLVQAIAARVALDADVAHLLQALGPLARTLRYGDVRGTDAGALATVIRAMVGHIAAGLVPAFTDVDAEVAAELAVLVDDARSALSLLAQPEVTAVFHQALDAVAERDRIHPLLAGRATRLLADAGVLDPLAQELRVSRALSVGVAASDGAFFIEGLLGGSGTVLVHDDDLLAVI